MYSWPLNVKLENVPRVAKSCRDFCEFRLSSTAALESVSWSWFQSRAGSLKASRIGMFHSFAHFSMFSRCWGLIHLGKAECFSNKFAHVRRPNEHRQAAELFIDANSFSMIELIIKMNLSRSLLKDDERIFAPNDSEICFFPDEHIESEKKCVSRMFTVGIYCSGKIIWRAFVPAYIWTDLFTSKITLKRQAGVLWCER